jgi:two-component system chemotaxis response regulator CheY
MRFNELTLLVVEPSMAQFLAVREMLHELGVEQVDHAANGADALARLSQLPFPGLALSAMHLPDMTAADLVQRMRSDPKMADTPFMLVSSEESYRYLEPVRQAGVVAIIHKPASINQLRQGLTAAVDLLAPESLVRNHPEIASFCVLVVDDSETSRRLITTVLGQLGVRSIVEAENGREAVDLIEASDYDLVVTDYHMPKMDGAALTRYIREESRQPAVPILMVTSETDESRLAVVDQAGVTSLCNKPFEPIVVRDLLERVLVFGR